MLTILLFMVCYTTAVSAQAVTNQCESNGFEKLLCELHIELLSLKSSITSQNAQIATMEDTTDRQAQEIEHLKQQNLARKGKQ